MSSSIFLFSNERGYFIKQLNAILFCSMGWQDEARITVLVVVGFL
jgi:hypothetical protein